MKQYKVRISSEAHKMLTEHIYFMAQVSPKAAREVKTAVLSAIRSLKIEPYRFRSLDEREPHCPYRLMYVPKWYGVIYLVEEDQVLVECIVDQRQEYNWLLSRFHMTD